MLIISKINILIFILIAAILPSCHKSEHDCQKVLFASIMDAITKPYIKGEVDKTEIDSKSQICVNFKPSTISSDYWPTIKEVIIGDLGIEFNVTDSIGADVSLNDMDFQYQLVDIDLCSPKTYEKRQVIINLSKGYYDASYNKGILSYKVFEGRLRGYEGIIVFEKLETCWRIVKYIHIGDY